jgi:hypothetical protein
VICFLADIYGNAPNPTLRNSPGYAFFLLVFIIIFGVVLAAMTRNNPRNTAKEEAEKKEAEEERLRDLHIKIAPNPCDKSDSKD